MIVDKVWKSTNTVRVWQDPRSSHTQRQTTFSDNVWSYFPPVTLCHTMKIWLLFVFLEIFLKSQKTWDLLVQCTSEIKKRIRERVVKSKGSGLPRMIQVGNLWVRSLSPWVENVWVRTPQVGNLVWYGVVTTYLRCQGETTHHTHKHTLPTHSLTNWYINTFLCVSHTNTLEVSLNLKDLIPGPNLPTIKPCW